MAFVPEELLKTIYRTNEHSVENDVADWEAPEPVITRFHDWPDFPDLLPKQLRDLLVRNPLTGPRPIIVSIGDENDSTDQSYRPEFVYDSERFSPRHVSSNFKKALSFLEECLELKDAYTALDLQLMEQSAQSKMNAVLNDLFDKDLTVAEEQRRSMANATRLVVVSGDDGGTIEAVNESSKLHLRAMSEKQSLMRMNQLRVENERATLGSPYRITERRDRLKYKYLHRLFDLVQLVEVTKHGMYEVFGVRPTYAVITSNSLKAGTDLNSLRLGIAPEAITNEIYGAEVLRFTALLHASAHIPVSDALSMSERVKERDRLLQQLEEILYGRLNLDAQFEQFKSDCLAVIGFSEPTFAHAFFEKIRAHSLMIQSLLQPAVEIESDIRDYLWKVSRYLERRTLHKREFVLRVSLADAIEGGKSSVVEFFQNGMSFNLKKAAQSISSGDLLLVKGVSAEAMLHPNDSVQTIEYKDIKDNKQTAPRQERTHQDSVGDPVLFHFSARSNEELPHVIFSTGAQFADRSTAAVSSPVFYGQKILQNLSLRTTEWNLKARSRLAKGAFDDIFLTVHLEAIPMSKVEFE